MDDVSPSNEGQANHNEEGNKTSFAGNYRQEDGNMFIGSHFRADGNIYINSGTGDSETRLDKGSDTDTGEVTHYGLCLASAPVIDPSNFVGRAAELERMKQVLQPGETAVEQRRLVLGGIGGIGKTQLAIAYARQFSEHYTAVFWLNATTELTLKASFRSIAHLTGTTPGREKLDDNGDARLGLRWLSDLKNKQWLLIFDNYDDTDQYNISEYLPNTAHGSVLITSRLPDLLRGQQMREVRVRPIQKIEESLQILQTRSQRDDIKRHSDARRLVERLSGLPLALVTAGAYLRKTTLTCAQYLDAYNKRFNINPRRPVHIQEYADRTLHTTWNLSYSRLESDDPLAAQTLKALAYFDNQEIWFDLVHAGLQEGSPQWLQEMAAEHIDFETIMGTLAEYCLVEVYPITQSYGMHSCVHDWTLAELNKVIDFRLYRYAFDCVAGSIGKGDWENLSRVGYGRLSHHGARLTHHHFEGYRSSEGDTNDWLNDMDWISRLLQEQVQLSAAERMYKRALAGKAKALGPDHTSTLDTVNNLGTLYADHGKLDEAERMLERALAGREKALGPDHTLTLDTVNNLGNLYRYQGKINEAEEMYLRALAGCEKALGSDHTSTLDTVHNLGNLYHDQGKLDKAEEMYLRALVGCEKTLGLEHKSTLGTVNNLGIVYSDQGKLDKAEQIYLQALAGYEKALGPDHTLTLDTVNNIGNLYLDQGKINEAEEMYLRALAGCEKALGSDHTSTLVTVNNLGNIYRAQGELDKAERMLERALAGKEKALGLDHTSTLVTVNILSTLYSDQGKLDEAERMLERALAGREKALGPDHMLTLDTVNNLGLLYVRQGNLDDAEEMLGRALAGFQCTLGEHHMRTRTVASNLTQLLHQRGRKRTVMMFL